MDTVKPPTSVPAMRAGKDLSVTSPYVWKAVPLNLAPVNGQVNAIVQKVTSENFVILYQQLQVCMQIFTLKVRIAKLYI